MGSDSLRAGQSGPATFLGGDARARERDSSSSGEGLLDSPPCLLGQLCVRVKRSRCGAFTLLNGVVVLVAWVQVRRQARCSALTHADRPLYADAPFPPEPRPDRRVRGSQLRRREIATVEAALRRVHRRLVRLAVRALRGLRARPPGRVPRRAAGRLARGWRGALPRLRASVTASSCARLAS